jgi:predicted transcriptional regulator
MADDFGDNIAMAADVVAAYVANHKIAVGDLPGLIHSVVGAFRGPVAAPEPEAPAKPAVSIKRSIQADHLVCLEDGKTFKSLKRHLATDHGLTPKEYREKWGLPGDYPMVAPAYAAARSELAKKMGLGQKARQARKTPEPPAAPKRAGRKPKASA